MFPKITLLEPLTRPSGCLTRPSVLVFPEVELPLKKDGFTSESTTLEALLRGEGVEKKVDAREEESIQEIQVPCLGHGSPRTNILTWCLVAFQGRAASVSRGSWTPLPGSLQLLLN